MTKREVLKAYAETGDCPECIDCTDCAYKKRCFKLQTIFRKIGARKLLKMFPEKREFDKSKILTCVTADQAKAGMKGYFASCISDLKYHFDYKNKTHLLTGIRDESFNYRFIKDNSSCYALFYPIDEAEG